MLLFIGLGYTLFVHSYSQLMLYFLIQVLSSFLLLISYLYSFNLLLTVSFLLKLSIFPFFFWYINVVYRFPNFILWLASTLHKVPILVMVKLFSLPLLTDLLWVSILLTTLVGGLAILALGDLRIILVLSSVGNNSWFILSQITNLTLFLGFVFVYSLRLIAILSRFTSLSKPVSQSSMVPSSYLLSFWVLSLSGMPPFPLFYFKVAVIWFLLVSFGLNYLFFIFLLFNSFMVIGYIQSFMKYHVHVFSSHLNYVIKY